MSSITKQQAYDELNRNHCHWDRKDSNHIVVWTSGYKTDKAHVIEAFLNKAGMWLMDQNFDPICGKTCNVFLERK